MTKASDGKKTQPNLCTGGHLMATAGENVLISVLLSVSLCLHQQTILKPQQPFTKVYCDILCFIVKGVASILFP